MTTISTALTRTGLMYGWITRPDIPYDNSETPAGLHRFKLVPSFSFFSYKVTGRTEKYTSR